MRTSLLLLILVPMSLVALEPSPIAQAQNSCTGSDHPTVIEICNELQRAERPDRVSKKEFRYESPRSDVSIALEPRGAFTIEKLQTANGSSFLIRIVEPTLLFRTLGELTFPIKVVLSISTGAVAPIRIDADSRCETILEFKQAGEPLNLDRLRNSFNLEWLYPTRLLSAPEVLGTQVRIKRLGQGEANLTLIIRDGTVEIARATRAVLDCANVPRSSSSTSEAIVEMMTPVRCFKPMSTRAVNIQDGQRHHYTAQNLCSRPIVCSWTAWVDHYLSRADSEDDLREGRSTRSRLTSGSITMFATIAGRRGDTNGEASGSFDTVTKRSIPGQAALNYWHRFTLPDCEWAQ